MRQRTNRVQVIVRTIDKGWTRLALSGVAVLGPALLGLAGCSDGTQNHGEDAGATTSDTKGSLPAKCKTVTGGGTGVDLAAQFSLSEFGGGELAANQILTLGTGGLNTGQTLDKLLKVANVKPATSAAELRITGVQLVYAAPDGAQETVAPFQCLQGQADGKPLLGTDGQPIPCDKADFGSLVPAGFDKDCTTGTPAESAWLLLRFTKPNDALERKATLKVLSKGDPQTQAFVVLLSTKGGVPKIKPAPETVDFGTVKIGTEKKEKVTITNIGEAELQVTAVDVAPTDAKAFKLEVDGTVYEGGKTGQELKAPLVIPPGKSHEAFAIFTAPDGNPHLTELGFHSNDKASPLRKITLKANQEVPCLKVVPDKKLNFGFVSLGQEAQKTVTLSSCGAGKVEISSLKLGGTNPDVFGVDLSKIAVLGGKPIGADNPITLGINEKVTVPVTCAPPSENKVDGKQLPFVAKLQLADNTVNPDKAVDIECYGTASTCPTAVINSVEGEEVIPQSEVHLKGSASFASSPTKAVKSFKWSFVKVPEGAQGVKFYPSDTAADVQIGAETVDKKDGTKKIWLNVAGEYQVKLVVTDTDGVESCQPAILSILVIPDTGIHVELVWDTPGDDDKADTGPAAGSDLDLHFAHQNATVADICQTPPKKCGTSTCACQEDQDADGLPDPFFHGLYDTYWYNAGPYWGNVKSGEDDPGLDLDDTDGWGPENLNLKTPENVKYTVGVHYWDDHGFGNSTATVNIFILGQLKGTYKQLVKQCDLWWVKQISWPSGDLLDVPGATLSEPSAGKITPGYKSAKFGVLGGVCK